MSVIQFRSAMLITAAAASLAVGASSSAFGSQSGQSDHRAVDMNAREEIRQSYRISPSGTVEVRGVAGPVSVETVDGAEIAEVHIVRMAATERELRCYRTDVRSSGGDLTIEHVQDRGRDCESINSRQEVRLRVPRSVNLDLSSIAGALNVGPLDGMLRVDSVAGPATIERTRAADISSIAGPLRIGLAPISSQGVRISSVVGSVELGFERGVDADLRVESVMGSVRSLSRSVDLTESEGSYRARVGSGGGRVSLSSVVGSVRLRQP